MILAFGTYDSSRHPRIAILIDGLRAHGYTVAEANFPLGFSTTERVAILKQPWRLPVFLGRMLSCWVRLARAAHEYRGRSAPEAVLVGYMGHFDVLLARRLFPRTPIILDHLIFAGDTARDRGAGGVKARLLSVLDRWAIHASTLVLTDTDEHRAMVNAPAHALTVPVGASWEWFEAGAAHSAQKKAPEKNNPLSVIFFGLFTPLQGAPVIARAVAHAIDAGANIAMTFIGTGQDFAEVQAILSTYSSVTWLDWVEPHDLPTIVAAHDVCLGIFSTTPKGLRVVPNKVYQGIAAGCTVITADTPPQRRVLAPVLGHRVRLVPPGNPEVLARALCDLSKKPPQTSDKLTKNCGNFSPKATVEPLVSYLASKGCLPEQMGDSHAA